MLDSCVFNQQPHYGTPNDNRRNSANANNNSRFGPSMPDVVEAVISRRADQGKASAKKIGDDQTDQAGPLAPPQPRRSQSNRSQISPGIISNNNINNNNKRKTSANGGRMAVSVGRHVVERSQSQLMSSTAHQQQGYAYASTQRRSRRSYDVNALRRSPLANGAAHHATDEHLSQPQTQLTLVLMGAPRVGKSALVNQFLWEGFLHEYRPTVEEFSWVEYGSAEQPNGQLLLQLIDSSGSRDFLAMRHLYYRTGDAFMVVYAVDDPASFVEALAMLREIGEYNSKEAPILLVANKSDLVNESPSDSNNDIGTPKSTGSGTSAAGEAQALPDLAEQERLLATARRMRISAKNLDQVKGAFRWLIDELVRHSRLPLMMSLRDGRPATDHRLRDQSVRKTALTRRRQSLPSRRTASELGIDEETLRRLMRRHEAQERHGCTIQ